MPRRVLEKYYTACRPIRCGNLCRCQISSVVPVGNFSSDLPNAPGFQNHKTLDGRRGREDKNIHSQVSRTKVVRGNQAKTPTKPLWQVIDEEGSYNFRPYAYTTHGILSIPLYSQLSGGISLTSRSSISASLQILFTMVAPK